MSQYIIQTEKLSYQYSKQRKVLDGVSLNIHKGSIYGFLGPNGAGKSTTMRLITGIIPEQQNAIKLFGKLLKTQFPQVFIKIGALVESPALYLHLSAYDNARSFSFRDSCPKFSFGKLREEQGKKLMGFSVHVNHALMDGFHVGQMINLFQTLLDE